MTIWYVARGAGLAALILLTITTAIGAAMTGRTERAGDRVVISYLHRVTASLGLALLALHIGTILADSYAHVGWTGPLIPFTSGYRPTWVGLGTLAAYSLVLAAATGAARRKLSTSERGTRSWRWLHAIAYGGWGLAMLHGIKSGTDTSVGWVELVYVGCAALVAGALALRVSGARAATRETQRATAAQDRFAMTPSGSGANR